MSNTIFRNVNKFRSPHSLFYAFSLYGLIEYILQCHSYGNFNINRCGVLVESFEDIVVKVRY